MNTEEMISPKDIYNSLWRCRDFELSHLWQRSIFLTAFLVLCFTGYASLIVKGCESLTEESGWVILLMVALVALVGLVFSILWIKMAKGSKAWYERYENAITKIERNAKYGQEIVRKDMDEDKVMHGSLPNPNEPNDCIFTTDAGDYSVSRINIIIGQVFMIVWIVFYVLSLWLFYQWMKNNACASIFWVIGGVLFLLIILWMVGRSAFAHKKEH